MRALTIVWYALVADAALAERGEEETNRTKKKGAAYEYLTLLGNAAQGIIIIISTIIGRLAG